MPHRHIYFFFMLFLTAFFVCGCENESRHTKFNEANAEIAQLTSENKKLRDQNRDLLQQQEALSINHEELEEWTEKLVDGYGPGVWYMDESTRPVFIKPVPSGNLKEITKELNLKFKYDGLPLITLTKAKGNIAYIRIDDATLLTQRMGTHGSTSYINAITYSLASVDQIDCVMFEFKEGDHAIPGKYCK